MDGYTRTALTYRSPIEGRVPADLFIPLQAAAKPAPAIVFMHGLPGTKETMAPLAAAYARAGVIGLCLSAPFSRDDISYRANDPQLLLPHSLMNTIGAR
jgi:dienelactone hydrolase